MTEKNSGYEQDNIQLELPLDGKPVEDAASDERKNQVSDHVDSKIWEEAIESTDKEGKITFRKRKKTKSKREIGYFRPDDMEKSGAFMLSKRSRSIFGIAALVLAGLDLLGMAPFARGLLFNLSDVIFYALGLDEVSYLRHSVTEMRVIVSLVIIALVGGLIIDLFIQLVLSISEGLHLRTDRRYYIWMLAAFAAVYGLLAFISIKSGSNFSSYSAFRFLAPLSMYGGGLIFYGLSVLRLE